MPMDIPLPNNVINPSAPLRAGSAPLRAGSTPLRASSAPFMAGYLWDYAAGMIYQTSTSNVFSRKYMLYYEGITMNYDGFVPLREDLGNVPFTMGYSGTVVVKESNYYPIVMRHTNHNASKNPILYNGKEIQYDVSGGELVNWYDYGARFYDAQIGRFHSIDPLAENFTFQSPYVYAANNPERFIDFIGMSSEEPDEDEAWQSRGEPEKCQPIK